MNRSPQLSTSNEAQPAKGKSVMPSTTGSENRRRNILGLTVLEMIIVLAAIAVVITVSVPGSSKLMAKYHLNSTSEQLFSGLELAQAEAAARSSMVVMCPSSNRHSCRRDGNWGMGWLIFSDGNGNGVAEDIELIKAFDAPKQTIQITATGAVKSQAAFTLTGLVSDHDENTGEFQICLANSKTPAKLVQISEDGWLQQNSAEAGACNRG
jgi:Tfp pilus assembly protein FimT